MFIERLNPTPRWSDATLYRGIAHFVEVPADTSLAFEQQVAQLLSQAEQTLTAIGSDKTRLLSATIYLTDRALADAFNRAWEAWLPASCAPSRACVCVSLLDPLMQVELAFVAAVGQYLGC